MTFVNLNEQMAHLACTKAAAQGGYGVRQSNPPSFMELQTRNHYKAWDGTLTILITPSGSGSEITINYSIAKTDFKIGFMAVAEATGAASMAASWLKSLVSSVAAELEHEAKTRQPSTSSPTTQPHVGSSSTSIVEEIMKFKKLLDAGAITQEEFDLIKSRLLS